MVKVVAPAAGSVLPAVNLPAGQQVKMHGNARRVLDFRVFAHRPDLLKAQHPLIEKAMPHCLLGRYPSSTPKRDPMGKGDHIHAA